VSLHKRLERLEVRAGLGDTDETDSYRERLWERYFHTYENARREIHGLEPLPDLPYTEEDREDDRRCLAEVIPAYRTSPGYQHGDGKAFLDHWEQSIKDKLAKGAQHG
jgi:hypothetical protein